MKYNINNIGKACLLLVLSSFGWMGCSDTWEDHYREEKHAEGTLWQAISQEETLSNFKTLLDSVGFVRNLNSSQVFTVFAPTNEHFTEADLQQLLTTYREQKSRGVKDKYNWVIKEFVQDHVALFNISVSSVTNDTLRMMNGKYKLLHAKDLSGSTFVKENILTDNGILYLLDTPLKFQPNLYESLDKDADLDSLAAFVHKYDVYKFYPALSVPGEVVEGKIQYLDSVTYLQNNLFNELGSINDEDSLYWMLVPSNTLWRTELEKNMQYFQYDKQVNIRDSLMYSFPRLKIVESMLFSRSINVDDSIAHVMKSTYASLLAAGKGYVSKIPTYGWRYEYTGTEESRADKSLFAGTEQLACSNGMLYKATDQWPLADVFLQNSTIVIEAEGKNAIDSVYTVKTNNNNGTQDPLTKNVTDSLLSTQISNKSFVEIAPKEATGAKVLFNIHNVLSNVKYNVSVVVPPSFAADSLETPNSIVFGAKILGHDATGKEITVYNSNRKKFTSNVNKVDTISLGNYTFKACSYGLSQAQVKVYLEDKCDPDAVKKGTQSATLRVDCIILKPVL